MEVVEKCEKHVFWRVSSAEGKVLSNLGQWAELYPKILFQLIIWPEQTRNERKELSNPKDAIITNSRVQVRSLEFTILADVRAEVRIQLPQSHFGQ